MKKFLVLMASAALIAVPAFAQEEPVNTASMNGLGVSFPNSFATSAVGVQFPGDPLDEQYPGGPQSAFTDLLFFTTPPAPQSVLEHGGVRQVRVADAADYPFVVAEIDELKALLTDRPDLADYMRTADNASEVNLPFLPVFPAAQVIRARAQYVETPALSGIAYVTAYRQDASPLLANEFLYTFQGLTADGETYVSAVFPVTAPDFPTEFPADFDYDAFIKSINEYFADSIASLNAADGEAFVPALSTLDSIIQSITVTE